MMLLFQQMVSMMWSSRWKEEKLHLERGHSKRGCVSGQGGEDGSFKRRAHEVEDDPSDQEDREDNGHHYGEVCEVG